MATTDRKKQSKKSLKNARAKLKRIDEKIARLEAELKERDEKAKKNLNPMGQVLQIMEKQSQSTNFCTENAKQPDSPPGKQHNAPTWRRAKEQ